MISVTNPETLDDWLQLLERRHPRAIDLGLERCRVVWEAMGSPRPAPRVFVVAGTNGKGSTVATLCSLLGALGYRHGCYTTPHIERYNERIQVDGATVSDSDLLEAFGRVERARGDVSLTYFEFGTLAAFDLLSRAGLDFGVMEIGLGGRLDAVNLLDADCAVITPIGLDHQEFLGPDRESIGREKAGIIRAGRPLVCGDPDPPRSVREAAAVAAPVRWLGEDFEAWRAGRQTQFRLGSTHLSLPLPALAGPHQLGNLATALAALLQVLPEAADAAEALASGVRAVRLPGRFERVRERPAVWIDVGHNPHGAQVIATALAEAVDRGEARRIRCVLAMLADKDAEAVSGALAGRVDEWYCAGLAGPRGQDGARLAARIGANVGQRPVRAFGTVRHALEAALADASADDGVLVFGSFLTAAEAYAGLRGDGARAAPAAGTAPPRC